MRGLSCAAQGVAVGAWRAQSALRGALGLLLPEQTVAELQVNAERVMEYLKFFGAHHEIFRTGLVDPDVPTQYLVTPFKWDLKDQREQITPPWINKEVEEQLRTWQSNGDAGVPFEDFREPKKNPKDKKEEWVNNCVQDLAPGDDGGDEDNRPLGGSEDGDASGSGDEGQAEEVKCKTCKKTDKKTEAVNSNSLLAWVRSGLTSDKSSLASAVCRDLAHRGMDVEGDEFEERILDLLHRK